MAKNSDNVFGDEYEAIDMKISWSVLSVIFFLLTLPAPYLVRLQPWRPQNPWTWPLVIPAVFLGLSTLGMICGLLGWRFSSSKGMAKWGMILNGVVLGLIALLYVIVRLIIWNR